MWQRPSACYGRVKVDIYRPTEIAIIADESADPQIVAEDLILRQNMADSPAWLFTTKTACR